MVMKIPFKFLRTVLNILIYSKYKIFPVFHLPTIKSAPNVEISAGRYAGVFIVYDWGKPERDPHIRDVREVCLSVCLSIVLSVCS